MNLIELSEQLKDVPDQYLLKEVQSPSGTYPAYLVVTELTRRKRMREQAAQEAPKSTVVEDLTRPAAPQGGLMSTPYASEELAAQDAMGAQPPVQMAGGGIVAFQGGGYAQSFDELKEYKRDLPGIGSPQEGFSRFLDWMIGTGEGLKIDPVRGDAVSIGEYTRRQAAEKEKAAITRQKEILADAKKIPPKVATITEAIDPDRDVKEPPAGKKRLVPDIRSVVHVPIDSVVTAPRERSPGSTVPVPTKPEVSSLPIIEQSLEGINALRVPTQKELQIQEQLGRSAYGGAVPPRYDFIQKEIAARQAELPSLRASNINDALMRAGLGIMGSRSPRFLQAVAEGGTAGLDSYRQGLKDIREGEKEIMAARASLANAQALYDQGMFNAGNQEKENAMERFRLGAEIMRTKDAALVQREELALREKQIRENARLKERELDMESPLRRAQAEYYSSARGQASGEDRLAFNAIDKAVKATNDQLASDPNYIGLTNEKKKEMWNEVYNRYLRIYTGKPPTVSEQTGTINRNSAETAVK